MKKLTLGIVFICLTLSLISCKNKKNNEVATQINLEFETESSTENQEITDLENYQIEEISEPNISQQPEFNLSISQNYMDYDYFYEEGIFTITKVDTITSDTQGVKIITSRATGFISGLPGTYIIDLPYTENWEINDRAYISYKKAYDDITQTNFISDILFIEKTDVSLPSRRQRLEEESKAKEESERLAQEEAQRIAEEESQKQAEAEKAAKKKAQDAALKRSQEQEAAKAAQRQKEQQQKELEAQINALIGQ